MSLEKWATMQHVCCKRKSLVLLWRRGWRRWPLDGPFDETDISFLGFCNWLGVKIGYLAKLEIIERCQYAFCFACLLFFCASFGFVHVEPKPQCSTTENFWRGLTWRGFLRIAYCRPSFQAYEFTLQMNASALFVHSPNDDTAIDTCARESVNMEGNPDIDRLSSSSVRVVMQSFSTTLVTIMSEFNLLYIIIYQRGRSLYKIQFSKNQCIILNLSSHHYQIMTFKNLWEIQEGECGILFLGYVIL